MPNVRTDHSCQELLSIVDRPLLWMIRGGLLGALGSEHTLRDALKLASRLSAQGRPPRSIILMPDGEIEIAADQIGTLWKILGLSRDRVDRDRW